MSGGAPDSVRCARLARAKWPLSGIYGRRTTIIHRTVRCAPDCSVSQRSAGPTVGRAIGARPVAEPTVGKVLRTVRWAPDMAGAPTVRSSDSEVLESEKIQKEKDLAGAVKTLRSLGTPDRPVVHRTVSGAPGWRLVNWPLSGICRRRTAKIHRTVRCAPECPVSQWSAGPTVGRAICAGHVARPTVGRGHRTVWCAPDMSGAPTTPRSATVGCAV